MDLFNSHENLHVCSGYYRETEQGQVRTGDLVKREGDREGDDEERWVTARHSDSIRPRLRWHLRITGV